MADKIVLVSDDSDFFDYVKTKLELRKSDELLIFSFEDIPEKLHLLKNSVVIINSESSKTKTLELLKIFKETPTIVIAFNEDENFKKKCYREGMFDYMTLLTPDSEFRARILPALNMLSLIEKNCRYRELLVKKKIITKNNEVYADYCNVMDSELEKITQSSEKAVLIAISPNEKSKFFMQPNHIETIILNSIRKNDILMNYAPNKYFLLMHDIDANAANKLWQKIRSQFSEKMYAGIVNIKNQSRQQVINEALNKLHESILYEKDDKIQAVGKNKNNTAKKMPYTNFKIYRQEFCNRLEQVIAPVFYQIQQKYLSKLAGMTIEQNSGAGYGVFNVNGKHLTSSFKITGAGFSKINIDITVQKHNNEADSKRINLEPEELESGLLEDLMEQFISEIIEV